MKNIDLSCDGINSKMYNKFSFMLFLKTLLLTVLPGKPLSKQENTTPNGNIGCEIMNKFINWLHKHY